MNLDVYHFALPTRSNDGAFTYERALTVWEELALDEGGFTELGERRGVWRDDRTGAAMRDTMRWYEVACSDAAASRLMKAAMNLFPDQVSFYVAKVGTANVVLNHPEAVRAVVADNERPLPPLYKKTPPGTYERPSCFAGKFNICTGESLQNG